MSITSNVFHYSGFSATVVGTVTSTDGGFAGGSALMLDGVLSATSAPNSGRACFTYQVASTRNRTARDGSGSVHQVRVRPRAGDWTNAGTIWGGAPGVATSVALHATRLQTSDPDLSGGSLRKPDFQRTLWERIGKNNGGTNPAPDAYSRTAVLTARPWVPAVR